MTFPELLSDDHPLLATAMPVFDYRAQNAQELEDLLLRTMEHYNGLGLAANQVGITANACAVTIAEKPMVMFNPLVTWLDTETVAMEEGCLTFANLWLKVSRPKDIQVTYQDAVGVRHALDLSGLDARVVLHETDHLLGVVFTSRVSKLKLSMAKKKAQKRK
jgi:peptide deformylase